MSKLISMRQVMGHELVKLARLHKDLYVVSMDLKGSLGLEDFAKKFPKRFVECGVAENNAAGVAAGLAKSGKKVFLASFSCFSPGINWATIKQSIAYNKVNVKIVGSHSGLMSGWLGATHQMLEDVAMMRIMPDMDVVAPADGSEIRKILRVLIHSPRAAYIRLVRPATEIFTDSKKSFTLGKSEVLKKGSEISVVGYGPILFQAYEAANKSGKLVEIINCSSIKPLDEETILLSAKKTGKVIVIEDHQKQGGLGEVVAKLLLENGIGIKFIHLGIDNRFGQSARDYKELWNEYGIGVNDLTRAINKLC